MAQLVKTMAGLAIASVKTVNGLAIASAKTVAGLDNTSGGGGITLDATSSGSATMGGGITTLTVSHTVGAGSNRVLIVALGNLANGASTASVTYGGVSPTATLWSLDTSSGTEAKCLGFIWIAPTAGTANIVATVTGTPSGYLGLGAVSYFGVNQTGTVGNTWRTPVDGDGSSNPGSMVVSAAQNGDAVISGIGAFTGASTLTNNQTTVIIIDPIGGSNYGFGMCRAAATGSTTVTWSNNNGFWSGSAVALIPA